MCYTTFVVPEEMILIRSQKGLYMAKVIVGMSGGVDSAVAAYLLKQEGHEVIGVTLRTWQSKDGKESRCCEIDDARRVAWKLGIKYYPFNCIAEFEKNVTKPFVNDYICGRTPNPCTRCNRYVKWDKMLYVAKVMEADYIATGHYAEVVKLENGRFTFKQALHAKKDQTYMLYSLTQDQIRATLMPLGKLTKDEVRNIAQEAGLPVAKKPDSQEICFVSEGTNYTDYIAEYSDAPMPGAGNFVDEEGNVLGVHKGIIHYTVGQRKGLGIALGYPAYVKAIRADRNEVVIGSEDSLFSDEIICGDINLMSIPELTGKLHCNVKVRYHHPGQGAYIERMDDNHIKVHFDSPVRAAAPGQAAVFYDENSCVIGGGVIC